MDLKIQPIVDQFFEKGKFPDISPIDQGLINDTYLVASPDTKDKFILQKINKHVFREPPKVMHNLIQILNHLVNKETGSYQSLSLVKTKDGEYYHLDKQKDYWRVFVYIDNTVTFDQAANSEMAYEASSAFGNYLKNLNDLDPSKLYETIPDFHNYKNRLDKLDRAIRENIKGRKAVVEKELDYIGNRSEYVHQFYSLRIPQRAIHSDTKINNILFGKQDLKALCVIDLDISMPGALLYDYGDMVRSYVNNTTEDDPEIRNVGVKMDIFKALTTGFLTETADFITPLEYEHLLLGAKLVILVQGIRYITDFLSGDPYYKIKYATHNLDRTRNQLELLRSIEYHEEEMKGIIRAVNM